MELSIDTLINIASLLVGGGAGGFFTLRWARKKAKAEAEKEQADAQSAQVDVVQKVQDTYQQIIADTMADRDHYKQERDESRERVEKLSRSFMDWRLQADNDRSQMKMDIARLGRKVQMMAPFMCGDLACKRRQRVVISDDGTVNNSHGAEGQEADHVGMSRGENPGGRTAGHRGMTGGRRTDGRRSDDGMASPGGRTAEHRGTAEGMMTDIDPIESEAL